MFSFTQSPRLTEFERQVLPHLDAAYNLARFLMRNDQDAEDIVQEAFLRWQHAAQSEVRSARAYLMTVVTRLCVDQLRLAQAEREASGPIFT